MKKRALIYGAIAVAAVLTFWGWRVVQRARHNLVTLDVRNADVRQVVRKIEWQVWEPIIVHKDVAGKVTLKVKDAPLEEVLNIVGEQTSCRWSALFPLYSTGKSLVRFRKAVRGDIEPAASGWTNLVSRGFSMRGGPFGDNLRSEDNKVNLNFIGQDLEVATLALARFARAQVVPEDGTSGQVQLRLNQVSVPKAVALLARQVDRKWERYYALQPGFVFGRDGGREGGRGRGGRGFGGPPFERPEGPDSESAQAPFTNTLAGLTNLPGGDTNLLALGGGRDGFQAMRERMEQVMQTLPPEQRQQIEQERQQREDFRQLTPEQRQQRFQEMRSNPEFQQRMENRMRSGLLNTMPEQRVERDRRMKEMRERFQQRQQQGPSR